MDTEMTASAVIMGEAKMTEREAIGWNEKSFDYIADGGCDAEYWAKMIEAQKLAIQALKNEQKRKELIRVLERDADLVDNTTKTLIEYLKECERK
jgi:hypothetical protein